MLQWPFAMHQYQFRVLIRDSLAEHPKHLSFLGVSVGRIKHQLGVLI